MHDWQLLQQQLDAEWAKPTKNLELIEVLHARYINAFKKFEDKVWVECGLPRYELLNARTSLNDRS